MANEGFFAEVMLQETRWSDRLSGKRKKRKQTSCSIKTSFNLSKVLTMRPSTTLLFTLADNGPV